MISTGQSPPQAGGASPRETGLRSLSVESVAAFLAQEKARSARPSQQVATSPVALDFSRTDLAFRDVSDLQLMFRRAVLYAMADGAMSRIARGLLRRSASLDSKLAGPLERFSACRVFCAGETIQDALDEVAGFAQRGQHSIIEHIPAPEPADQFFDQAMQGILTAIDAAAQSAGGAAPRVFIRLSSIIDAGVLARYQVPSGRIVRIPEHTDRKQSVAAWERFERIAEVATQRGVFVVFGTEGLSVQPAFYERMLDLIAKYNQAAPIVQITAQMYRPNCARFVQRLLDMSSVRGAYIGIHLVRGDLNTEVAKALAAAPETSGYIENAAELSAVYRKIIGKCLFNLRRVSVCLSSHSPEACSWFFNACQRRGIAPGDPRISFQQHQGVADHVSLALVAAGCNVFRAVPYGPETGVFPFVLDRLHELKEANEDPRNDYRALSRELSRRRRERLARLGLGKSR